jgi:hypothetical protein
VITAVTRNRIAEVERLIRPYIRRTPHVDIAAADFGLPRFPLHLKLELMQHSGSFKARGAFANLLLRDVPSAGVGAASRGKHGVAVVYAAQRLGVGQRHAVRGAEELDRAARILPRRHSDLFLILIATLSPHARASFRVSLKCGAIQPTLHNPLRYCNIRRSSMTG